MWSDEHPEHLKKHLRMLGHWQSFHELRPLPAHPHPRSNTSYPVRLLPKWLFPTLFIPWQTYSFHWLAVCLATSYHNCSAHKPQTTHDSSHLHPTTQAEPVTRRQGHRHTSASVFMTYQRVITPRKVMIPLYSVICVLCPVWGTFI